MTLLKRLKRWLTPAIKNGDEITVEHIYSVAISCVEEDSARTMASGRPDWKAELMAASSARAVIDSIEAGGGSPCDYGRAIISALNLAREGYHQDAFQDDHSYGPATFGSIASNLHERLSTLGCTDG